MCVLLKQLSGRIRGEVSHYVVCVYNVQMEVMLSFKHAVLSAGECPTPADLRQALQDFNTDLKTHCGASHSSGHSTHYMTDKR